MARTPLVNVINIAPELEREARAGQRVQANVSDGVPEAAGAIAREFSGMASRIGQLADHAAQQEGLREGHLAGMDPEFRLRNDNTIRGEAFDRAGRETALARTRVEIQSGIEQTAMKHQADPQGLAKSLGDQLGGWLAGADPSLHPEIRNLFASGSLAAQRQATRQLWARQAAEQRASLQAELDQGLKSLHQAAFASGLDPKSDTVLAGHVARLQASLGRVGPDGKRLVDPATATKLIASAKEEVATARLYGAFDRLPDLASKQTFIDKFVADYGDSAGQAAIMDFGTFQRVRGHLEGELRRSQSQARQAGAGVARLVTEVQHRADKGYAVQPSEMAALEAKVATTGDPDLVAKLADAKDSLAFQQSARRLSLPELEVAVSTMRQELAANPSSIADRGRVNRRLEKAEALLKSAQSEIKSNPLGWEARVGMTEVVPMGTVDFAQPGAGEAWGAARIAQAEEAAQRHGLGRPVYLQPTEQRALARQFEQGGQAGLQAVTVVRRVFGDRAEAVLRELGREAPVGALVGHLALKSPGEQPSPGVLDAAEGLHLRKQQGYKPLAPPESKSSIEAQSVVGDALSEAPSFLSAAMRTADAIYETRANREGKRDQFEPRIWRQALAEALGEVTIGGSKYGGIADVGRFFSGNKIVIPPSVPQERAADLFKAITPDDLGEAFGAAPQFANGRQLTRQELRGVRYVTVAPGKYKLKVGDGWALDASGRQYVLDLEAVLPAVLRRRPDLR